jgi:ATPase family associated with various cellular activities (AAA)
MPDPKKALTDYHILLSNPLVRGFCLKDKCWRRFAVDCIHDIAWNKSVFDSLVLPDGYKDLILAHVESQLLDGGGSFDDVINGKGGGLVILLAGEPGVGKTLTVESVAERIEAPLYKMELRVGGKKPKKKHVRPPRHGKGRHVAAYDSEPEEADETDEITEDFELAARWGACLLIDECDTYLQRRSDVDARRNRVVAGEYPSLSPAKG